MEKKHSNAFPFTLYRPYNMLSSPGHCSSSYSERICFLYMHIVLHESMLRMFSKVEPNCLGSHANVLSGRELRIEKGGGQMSNSAFLETPLKDTYFFHGPVVSRTSFLLSTFHFATPFPSSQIVAMYIKQVSHYSYTRD
jgi:hypothetical protein